MLNQIYAKHTGQTADTIGAPRHVPEARREAQQSAPPVHKRRTSPPRKYIICCANAVNAFCHPTVLSQPIRPGVPVHWHIRAEQLLDRDTFKSADEARDFGLLDEVIEQRPAPPPDN